MIYRDRECPICHRQYTPRRFNQATCGEAQCRREWKAYKCRVIAQDSYQTRMDEYNCLIESLLDKRLNAQMEELNCLMERIIAPLRRLERQNAIMRRLLASCGIHVGAETLDKISRPLRTEPGGSARKPLSGAAHNPSASASGEALSLKSGSGQGPLSDKPEKSEGVPTCA